MKKILSLLLALMLMLAMTGCNAAPAEAEAPAQEPAAEEAEAPAEEPAAEETEAPAEEPAAEETEAPESESVVTRIGSLKGPTTIGLLHLMAENNTDYTYQMETDASALMTSFVKGDLDVALIPANAAAIWNQKIEGGVTCIDVNTLGVLYIISSDASIDEISDLSGKTIYLPGQGTSPDYVIQYLLKANGMAVEDVTLEYKSEGTEVIAALAADPNGIGLLPQPAVTAACAKLEGFSVVLDLTEEWGKVSEYDLLTGVTVVKNEFLAAHPEAVDAFLTAHQSSTQAALADIPATAQLVVDAGIIEKAPVAEKAIPACNVTCITGEEMQAMVNNYLSVLFELNPAAVGGQLPEDSFYYLG